MPEVAPTPEPEPYKAKFKVCHGQAHSDSELILGVQAREVYTKVVE